MSQKIGTLRLALTFAGCFLGAGYVSGQELCSISARSVRGGFWGSCSRSRCSAAPECCSCG